MKKTSSIVFATAFALFFSIAVVSTATAKNASAAANGRTRAAAANRSLAISTGQSDAATAALAKAAEKLTEAKLKVCQNKEAAIQRRDDQLTKMAENMLVKFDSIATRVETYYTDKAVPAGKTISNYDALVAEIAAKNSAVQVELDQATADAAAFDCASDDPKGQLTQFRTDMQAVKQALKDYRTAIKNLIVAIRSVTGTTESTSNSTSNQ